MFATRWCVSAILAACAWVAGAQAGEVILRSPPVSPLTNLPWAAADAAEVARLTAEIKDDLPAYSVHTLGPWVIATNLSEKKVAQYLEGTISVYAAQIQRQLFSKVARRKPVKVLLFKDRLSYESGCKKVFQKIPDTPYGFYSRVHNAMAMNIGTGGGTLLHEMVHAMAEEEFPAIPAWLNEGLGSLYEASDMRDSGAVIGVKNWRLNELLPAVNGGYATPLSELLGMRDTVFYGEQSTLHYAVSRYLMQYLQEQGKLESFYSRVRDRRDADARATLLAVFGNAKTLEAIEAEYHAWVKGL